MRRSKFDTSNRSEKEYFEVGALIEEAFETNGDGGTNTFEEKVLRFGVTSQLFFHLDRILLLYYSFLCKCAMVCGTVRLIFVEFFRFSKMLVFLQGSRVVFTKIVPRIMGTIHAAENHIVNLGRCFQF